MSTDWAKYSAPEETRGRGRKPAAEYFVVALNVEETRKLPGQSVEHTPDGANKNRAHTDVYGPKDPEVREKLLRISGVLLAAEE